MTDTPPDWVIRREAELCGVTWLDDLDYGAQRRRYHADSTMRALCGMILKHEQPPVDRKLLCAREACMQSHDQEFRSNIRKWEWIAVRAIELWEEG